MSLHDGHRQRLRARYEAEGLDNFTDIQALELLLFHCIPRQDTNELAHLLLERFGSFSQVLETSPEELAKVKGIGEKTARFLSLLPDITRYYRVDRSKREAILKDLEDCGAYLTAKFSGRCRETVFLLCLDAKCKLLCCPEINEGGTTCAAIPLRRVVEAALASNAVSVILAHNHPSGLAIPSREDVLTTRRVAAALAAVDIRLADHIVVADDEFVSMLQSNYYDPDEYWG